MSHDSLSESVVTVLLVVQNLALYSLLATRVSVLGNKTRTIPSLQIVRLLLRATNLLIQRPWFIVSEIPLALQISFVATLISDRMLFAFSNDSSTVSSSICSVSSVIS